MIISQPKTKFSACIPLYNKREYILRAVKSVLNQTFQDFELIIVNDGSTDDGFTVIANWLQSQATTVKEKVKLVTQHNRGEVITRNHLAELSTGEYVAFLDADDEWLPNHLEELNNLIEKHKSVDLYSTAFIMCRDEKTAQHSLSEYCYPFRGIVDYFKVMTISSGFINASVACIHRKNTLTKLANMRHEVGGDLILWAKCSNSKGIAFSSVPTAKIHLNAASASKNGSLTYLSDVYSQIEMVSKSWCNRRTVAHYLKVYLAKNIAGIRLSKSYADYLLQVCLNVRKVRLWVSIMGILVSFLRKKSIRRRMII